MKTILFLALSAITFTASAQIEVYKQAVAVTRTGNGNAQVFANSGWFVFNQNDISVVTADSRHKQFSVDSYIDWSGEAVHSVRLITNAFVRVQSGRYQDAILKGTFAPVVINYDGRKPIYDHMPPSFVVSGTTWGLDTNSVPVAEEFRGTLGIDAVRTIAANKAAATMDDTVESLRQYLLGKSVLQIHSSARCFFSRLSIDQCANGVKPAQMLFGT